MNTIRRCPLFDGLIISACLLLTAAVHSPGSKASGTTVAPAPPPFRLPDDRPKRNRDELQAAGLRVIESKHLILVTDLPLESVVDLPALADVLFVTLEERLGKLAPNIAGTEFQVTGYLIDSKERFEQAGVLPPEQFQFRHGRHLGYQFWMNNQTSDYYRRHLLLHEFVHCFMMCEFGGRDIPPLWYTEGIAEYFATHQLGADIAKTRFGVLPNDAKGFEGWGRIAEIRKASAVGTDRTAPSILRSSLEALLHPADNSFSEDLQYAQAWAAVWLINNHPELKSEFAPLSRVRTRQDFLDAERAVPEQIWKRMAVVWPLFLDSLVEGFDVGRSFPDLQTKNQNWTVNRVEPLAVTVNCDREWQPVGMVFEKGQTVALKCSGRYIMHDMPRPWVSEPQGITIDYCQGRPLGEVVAILVSPDGQFCSGRIPVGNGTTISFPYDAELWLQINDSAARRAGNSGSVQVLIH